MTAPLLQVSQLSKRFGGFVALDTVDFNVAEGERVGLIGPNGSGKSNWSTASAAPCTTRLAASLSAARRWMV